MKKIEIAKKINKTQETLKSLEKEMLSAVLGFEPTEKDLIYLIKNEKIDLFMRFGDRSLLGLCPILGRVQGQIEIKALFDGDT